jgi:hypothetical protein
MNDIQLMCEVQDTYAISFRPNDRTITISEILDFVEYCLDFYGPGGVYDYGFTFSEICRGMIARFGYRPSVDFDGDTVDREYVREMVFDIRELEVRLSKECA